MASDMFSFGGGGAHDDDVLQTPLPMRPANLNLRGSQTCLAPHRGAPEAALAHMATVRKGAHPAAAGDAVKASALHGECHVCVCTRPPGVCCCPTCASAACSPCRQGRHFGACAALAFLHRCMCASSHRCLALPLGPVSLYDGTTMLQLLHDAWDAPRGEGGGGADSPPHAAHNAHAMQQPHGAAAAFVDWHLVFSRRLQLLACAVSGTALNSTEGGIMIHGDASLSINSLDEKRTMEYSYDGVLRETVTQQHVYESERRHGRCMHAQAPPWCGRRVWGRRARHTRMQHMHHRHAHDSQALDTRLGHGESLPACARTHCIAGCSRGC